MVSTKKRGLSPIIRGIQLEEQAGLRMLRDRVEFILILSNPLRR